MNRTCSPSRSRSRLSSLLGPRGLLLVGMLVCAGGCEVEDPIAYILPGDAGTGPLSTGDEGPGGEWVPPGEGALPDCARGVPDAGAPCADAGTAAE
jgi:hypothetical protein